MELRTSILELVLDCSLCPNTIQPEGYTRRFVLMCVVGVLVGAHHTAKHMRATPEQTEQDCLKPSLRIARHQRKLDGKVA